MFEQPADVPSHLREPLIEALLAMADDKFLLGHRNGDWTGLGPFLEADIAFSNIAQDEIAHAQELYKIVARLQGRDADVVAAANALAYGRSADQRLSCAFVESGDDFDWAVAVVRQCFFDHLDVVRFERLQASTFKPLAELAGKMFQEVRFHVDHFDAWVLKLGLGTAESKERLQAAIQRLWPLAGTLFAPVEGQDELLRAGVLPQADPPMLQAWLDITCGLLARAGITPTGEQPAVLEPRRRGPASPELSAAITEISEVYQVEPDAQW